MDVRELTEVDGRFEQADRLLAELKELIAADGEKTRRHIDIVVEQMIAEWRTLSITWVS